MCFRGHLLRHCSPPHPNVPQICPAKSQQRINLLDLDLLAAFQDSLCVSILFHRRGTRGSVWQGRLSEPRVLCGSLPAHLLHCVLIGASHTSAVCCYPFGTGLGTLPGPPPALAMNGCCGSVTRRTATVSSCHSWHFSASFMPKLPVLAREPRKYQKRPQLLAISAQTIVAVLALALGSLRMVQAEANDTDTTPHYSPPNLKLGSTLAGVMVLLATCVLAIYWIWHNLKHGTPDAYAVGGRWRRPTALGMGQLNPLDKEPPSSDAQSPTAWETDPPGSATSRLETGGLGSSTRVLGENPMLQRGRIG